MRNYWGEDRPLFADRWAGPIDPRSLWQWLGEMAHAFLVAIDPGETEER